MPDLFEELTFQMKKRKVELKPGHFNQTYHYNSFSLGGSANIVEVNRFSPILPNLKLYVNGSLDCYTGGIGTQLIRDGDPARSGDLILSFGASVGWGHNSRKN